MSSGADTAAVRIMSAPDILQAGVQCMADRAKQRDHADGERSISRAVHMFNALRGQYGPRAITEREGWVFMALLKLSRAEGGAHNIDDYIDAAAYMALAGEAAERDQEIPF